MMKAMKAVALLAAAAMCGTVWGAAPGAKAHNDAKTRAKAVAKKPVKKAAPAAKAPVAKRAVPKAQARNARAAAPKVAAPAKQARPAVASARLPARPPVREPHWTQLPPSRFYPNGIPELRPEFMHPLPTAQPPQEAKADTSHVTAGHPEVAP